MDYASERVVESKAAEGVRYAIARMSFARRVDLTKKVWDLMGRSEFLHASDDPREKLEAVLLANEVDRVYVEWGLVRVEGLTIDGQEATPALLVARGPQELCGEVLAAIKSECGLSDEEQKN